MRREDQIAHRVHALETGDAQIGTDAERQLRRLDVQPGRHRRTTAGRCDDDVRGERASLVTDCCLPVLAHGHELGELGAADEAHARLGEGGARERGERVVEPVEGAVEHVDRGDVVTGDRERRARLGADQPRPDHDDALRLAGERLDEPGHAAWGRVDVRHLEPRDPRRPVREPRRQDDPIRLDLGLTRDETTCRQVGLADMGVEPVDPELVETGLVGEEHGRARREALLRQRRAVDRQTRPDQERSDAVPGEPRGACVSRDAVPDDRDLGLHCLRPWCRRGSAASSGRSRSRAHSRRPHGRSRRSRPRRTAP